MKMFGMLYQWMFKRLPWRFSVPMLVVGLVYFLLVFPWLVYHGTLRFTEIVLNYLRIGALWQQYLPLREVISALIILGFALLGAVLSYGLAAILYRLWRRKPLKNLSIHAPVLPDFSGRENADGDSLLKNYQRIGIILAGGGAKGAYQAGAMKAIYEFLEKHHAHHKVKMIAGTSIGSWNSMFWLSDLIKGPNGEAGLHEQWWHRVNVPNVIQPVSYRPMNQNYFLSSQPWQEGFDMIFKHNREAHDRLMYHLQNPDAPDAMHFYFTRSNVERAHLEFTTNRSDLSDIPENLPVGQRPRPPVPHDIWKKAQTVDDMRTGVFASMDLPPLFKYTSIGDEYFEDGGVVDNLPIRFGTELENCDLLFILPLNASFDETADQNSVMKRLFRVMNVRQGVLERNSFKMIYLYNELAGLRQQAEKYENSFSEIYSQLEKSGLDIAEMKNLKSQIERILPAGHLQSRNSHVKSGNEQIPESAAGRARLRRHKAVQVFSICPAPELAINTSEFWKTEGAGRAFRLMYEYSWSELEKFDFRAAPDWIRMALVSPHGQVTYLEDF